MKMNRRDFFPTAYLAALAGTKLAAAKTSPTETAARFHFDPKTRRRTPRAHLPPTGHHIVLQVALEFDPVESCREPFPGFADGVGCGAAARPVINVDRVAMRAAEQAVGRYTELLSHQVKHCGFKAVVFTRPGNRQVTQIHLHDIGAD